MRLVLPVLALALLAAAPTALAGDEAESRSTIGWAGRIEGVRHWLLPPTANGLQPSQSWHAIGTSPSGDVYIGGMDHETNAALYRLSDGRLEVVGDARSASEQAHNWQPGETAQKFHTRPLWHDGRIYVATMDRSSLDDQYLSRRGFHWYAYDPQAKHFSDLSASAPGGTGAPHGSLVALASDPARNVIYGAGVPTSEIYRFDVAKGVTVNLGRPKAFDRPYVYSGRVMWVDSRGRLYFTAGNPAYGAHPLDIYGHVYTYDPSEGLGERRDWMLKEPRALEVGQCVADGKFCFFADDQGHVYRFDDEGPKWSYVGSIATGRTGIFIWMFQVSPDGRKAFAATTSYAEAAEPSFLYEFDLTDGTTRRLCSLAELDPEMARRNIHTGSNAWDAEGRFYFASFAGASDVPVMITRIDPAKLPFH